MSNNPYQSRKIYIELSEKSLNLYKKYAEMSQNKDSLTDSFMSKSIQQYPTLVQSPSQARVQPSLSKVSSVQSLSSVAGRMSVHPNTSQSSGDTATTKVYQNFLSLEAQQLNADPSKYLSEKDLNIYFNYLNVGFRGAQEPNQRSLKLYDDFLNEKQVNEKIF